MSAVVCGKRSHFDELHGSPPIAKRHRCGGSPARFPTPGFSRSSSPPSSPSPSAEVLHLRTLFPEMDGELVEKVLESCSNNLDAAIKSLSDLRLSNERQTVAAPSEQQLPENVDWVELFVREMLSATSVDDARARATRALQSFEKTIVEQNSTVLDALQKNNEQLKSQLGVLKRAFLVQHEKSEAEKSEMDKLKQTLVQYEERLRTVEMSNYALSVHLKRAQGNSSIPGHFHPDVF